MGDTAAAGTRVDDEQPARTQLPRLTALRVVGALAVFAYHLHTHGVLSVPMAAPVGYVGVAFFFVLSGLVLAWGTRPGLPVRTFWRRRFARVYPAHFVMLLVAVVVPVVAVTRSWHTAAANSLLLQAWWPQRSDITYGMNGVSWSLSDEAWFYLTFPLAVVLLRRARGATRLVLVGAALLAELLVARYWPEAGFALPLARFPEFLLGVVAGLALREGWRPRLPLWATALAAVVVVVVLRHVARPEPDAICAVPFAALLVAAAVRDLAGRGGWLTRRALVFAGEASFAFYLVHELVILNVAPHLSVPPAAAAVVLLAVSCAAAVLLHVAVERPCNRLLRDRSKSVALA